MLASAPHVISTQEVPSALTLSPRCPFWCLEQPQEPREGHNVTGVWERNVTGRGVTVVVVDDGVEHTIKDIQPNYVSACTGWRPAV